MRLLLVVLFGIIGAILKFLSSIEGSKAALIDALTCIANLLILPAVTYAIQASQKPPDSDHPYGHARYEIAGVLWTTMVYCFVTGASVTALIVLGPSERINLEAAFYAALGVIAYIAAILIARTLGIAARAYAAFTFSEVYEGLTTVCAALAGSILSPLYDYLAAMGLVAYLAFELFSYTRFLTHMLTERIPPTLIDEVTEILRREGLNPIRVRLRPLLPGEYIGEAVVEPLPDIPDIDIQQRVSRAQNILKKRRIIIEVFIKR